MKAILIYFSQVSCGGCHTILVGQRRNEENESEESKQTVKTKK